MLGAHIISALHISLARSVGANGSCLSCIPQLQGLYLRRGLRTVYMLADNTWNRRDYIYFKMTGSHSTSPYWLVETQKARKL